MKCEHDRDCCVGLAKRNEDDYRCRSCWKKYRQEKLKQGKFMPLHAAVFEISRHYGGPEEGGWWYDWVTLVETVIVSGYSDTLKVMRKLHETYPQPKYNRHSVLGSHDYSIQLYYDLSCMPKETTHKPRYE